MTFRVLDLIFGMLRNTAYEYKSAAFLYLATARCLLGGRRSIHQGLKAFPGRSLLPLHNPGDGEWLGTARFT